jgi:hypothetical protein
LCLQPLMDCGAVGSRITNMWFVFVLLLKCSCCSWFVMIPSDLLSPCCFQNV